MKEPLHSLSSMRVDKASVQYELIEKLEKEAITIENAEGEYLAIDVDVALSLINSEVLEALNRLKTQQVDMLRHQRTGYYDTKDPRIKCVEVSAIEAESRRYE